MTERHPLGMIVVAAPVWIAGIALASFPLILLAGALFTHASFGLLVERFERSAN